MSVTSTIAAKIAPRRRRTLYMGLSALMAIIALVGFGPGYLDALVVGASAHPLVLHIHAAVFVGWLGLFGAQAALAANGHIRAHLAVGRVGVWYGAALILVGVYTTVIRSAALPEGGQLLLYAALLDMVLFGAFFGAAVAYRREPEAHKRLMTVAATTLLIAAVARMPFWPAPPLGPVLRFMLWSLPIIIAMAVDLRRYRSLHPVYLIGLLAFAVRVWSVPLSRTDAWAAFSGWVFGFAR